MQFIVGAIGASAGRNTPTHPANPAATRAMIAFICLNISVFATTWGPVAWIVVGEIFPLTIRSRGVGLSTSSNWFWNCIIGIITPYLVDALGSHVFFMWGGLCCVSFLFALFLVPETKGLTLEQVDKMLEETTPFTSRDWKPHSTFASEIHLGEKKFEIRAAQSAVPKTHATESVVPTTEDSTTV
jgi:MFS family permease